MKTRKRTEKVMTPIEYAQKIQNLLKKTDYSTATTALRIARDLIWHKANSEPLPDYYSALGVAKGKKNG